MKKTLYPNPVGVKPRKKDALLGTMTAKSQSTRAIMHMRTIIFSYNGNSFFPKTLTWIYAIIKP
jgi:hypothetical protein